MSPICLRLLEDRGWTMTQTNGVEELLALSESLGQPTPSRMGSSTVDHIRPMPKHEARPASLSALHGLDAFPLHTDTAHWRKPARYVLLRAATEECGSRPTVIVDSRSLRLQPDDASKLRRVTFSVHSGRNSFLCTIMSGVAPIVRFDAGCMFPTSTVAAATLDTFRAELQACYQHQIHWKQGDTLVLDNWRSLHGRARGSFNDSSQRLLQRVLVNNPTESKWP